jgi:hypothetical protein
MTNRMLVIIRILCLPKLLLLEEEEAVTTFFEDNSDYTNGTIWIKSNYTFTNPSAEEID